MLKQLKKIYSVSFESATAFSPSGPERAKMTQKRALVNRKDPFSNENSIKYGPYGSIRNRKSNGSLKISKLISPRTTLVDTPFMGGCLKYVFDILAKHVPGSTI